MNFLDAYISSMSIAAFLGVTSAFVPYAIVVAAIAVTVVQRNLRAPIMFSGIIFSTLLFAATLEGLMALVAPDRAAALRAQLNPGAGCETLMLPYITTGLVPRANVFFMSWVTAYLAWCQSQWAKAGGTPTNPFVWAGIGIAWALMGWNAYSPDAPQCAGRIPTIITVLVGALMGSAWGAVVGAASPTSLYFAPLASDNVVCARSSKQVMSCTIGASGS